MNVLGVAVEVIDALNRCKAGYMLVGSLASNLYGIPRNTNDADFVLAPQTADAESISTILGDSYKLDPQISFESITLTLRRVLNHAETGFLIEFFELSDDADDLDLNYLYRWTDMHGTVALLKELLANTPRL